LKVHDRHALSVFPSWPTGVLHVGEMPSRFSDSGIQEVVNFIVAQGDWRHRASITKRASGKFHSATKSTRFALLKKLEQSVYGYGFSYLAFGCGHGYPPWFFGSVGEMKDD
jgi:hypothetical protein